MQLSEAKLAHLDLGQLAFFEALLKTSDVAAASAQLGISSTAGSRNLKVLAATFGDALFEKQSGRLVATSLARSIDAAVFGLLAKTRALEMAHSVAGGSTTRRAFVVGVHDQSAIAVIPALVSYASRVLPDILVEVRCYGRQSELVSALEGRQTDIAIGPMGSTSNSVVVAKLFEDSTVLAMRANNPISPSYSIEELLAAEHVAIASMEEHFGNRNSAIGVLGASRRVAAVVPTVVAALALIATSDLVAYLPASALAFAQAHFELKGVASPIDVGGQDIRVAMLGENARHPGVEWLFKAAVSAVAIAGLSD